MVRPLRAGRVESSQGQRSIVSPQTVAPITMPSMTMTPSLAIQRGMFLSRRWSVGSRSKDAHRLLLLRFANHDGGPGLRVMSPPGQAGAASGSGRRRRTLRATARERGPRSALFGPCQTRDELDPEEARQFAPLRLGET